MTKQTSKQYLEGLNSSVIFLNYKDYTSVSQKSFMSIIIQRNSLLASIDKIGILSELFKKF